MSPGPIEVPIRNRVAVVVFWDVVRPDCRLRNRVANPLLLQKLLRIKLKCLTPHLHLISRSTKAPGSVAEPPPHHNNAIGHFDGYWRSLTAKLECFPSRKDLDPVAMGAMILPWMLIVELREDEDGIFFFYRLCGTEMAALVGHDVTGQTSREVVSDKSLKVVVEPYFFTLREEIPSFWETSVYHELYHWRPTVRGIWPLSTSGEKIDMFVNLTVPAHGRPLKGA